MKYTSVLLRSPSISQGLLRPHWTAAFVAILSFFHSDALYAVAFPPAVAAWTSTDKANQRTAGTNLINAIAAAKASGASSYSIPVGNYRFNQTTTQGTRQVFVKFIGYDNFTIYGNNSTFYFEDDRLGIYIGSSSNFTIQELNIDYQPLPYTQGTIKAIDLTNKTMKVLLESTYDTVTPRFAGLSSTANNPEIRGAVIASDGKFKRNQNLFRVMPFISTPKNADGTYNVSVLPFYGQPMSSINAAVNDRVVFGIRGDGAILVEGCDHVTLTNFDLYASPGLCFTDSSGYGQNTYRDCNIPQRWETNRLVCGNADGFHSVNTEVGPLIEDCDVTSLLDDGVNVHGVYSRVLTVESLRSIVVEQLAWRGSLTTNRTYDFVNAPNSAPIGRRTGTAAYLSYDDPAVPGTGTVPAHRLTLTSDLTNVQRDDYITCLDFTGKGAIIRDNSFTNILTRGILYRTSNGNITNNNVTWTGLYGLSMMPSPGAWSESAYCETVDASYNDFTDTYVFENADNQGRVIACIYAYAPGYTVGARQKFLTFGNNIINRTAGHGICVTGTATATIWTNQINDYGNGVGGNGINLTTVTGLSTGGNTYDMGAPGGINYVNNP